MVAFTRWQVGPIRRWRRRNGGILWPANKLSDVGKYTLSAITKIAHNYKVTSDELTDEARQIQYVWIEKTIEALRRRQLDLAFPRAEAIVEKPIGVELKFPSGQRLQL